MSDLNALRNLGVVRFGPDPGNGEKTVVVVGVARGGTSMVATVLERLGIFMGDQAAPPVFEDVRLANALERGTEADARQILREYDQRHAVWAFKRPGLVDQLDHAHSLFRNPVYVVVFRDVLGIANRNAISMKSDLVKSMKLALRQYENVVQFLEARNPSALLLSNEKVLLHPSRFVAELSSWLVLQPTEEQSRRAAAGILPDNPHYLDQSRLHFLGYVDHANTQVISGWAFIRGRRDPAVLTIAVNGRTLASVTADHHRGDVYNKGVHPTGFCGFRLELTESHQVSVGDRVDVHFSLGNEPLRGTPRTIEAAPDARPLNVRED